MGMTMKRLVFLMLIAAFVAGCAKVDDSATNAGLRLINPLAPENDESIEGAISDFRKKSFLKLAGHCWLDAKPPAHILLFSKPGDGSHASGAEIGGLFSEYDSAKGKWKIKARATSFSEEGVWGEAPQPLFIRLGPDRYGFIMEYGSTGQGYTQQVLAMYGVIDGRFVKVLTLPTHADNSGAVEEDSAVFTADVGLYQTVDDKKDFYDLTARLVTHGDYPLTPDDEFGRIFGKSPEARFTFKNGAYVVTTKKAKKGM